MMKEQSYLEKKVRQGVGYYRPDGDALNQVATRVDARSGMSERQKSFLMVTLCTFIGAAAQILIKSGAGAVHATGVVPTLMAMATNPHLVFGYSLYGLSAVLMVMALRHGE